MKVGIIGTGTMGPSIAQVFSQCNMVDTVYICKGHESSKKDGMEKIIGTYNRMVEKGKLGRDEADTFIKKIVSGSKNILADADLVIEAVVENLLIKQEVFRELDGICKKSCVFASNTSSLSISKIGAGLSRPLIGMHFFSPVSVMKLVEIVVTDSSAEAEIEHIRNIAQSIGKTPVVVKESPGFIVNRILIPMINEAVSILSEGIADREDIDTAMKLGANQPMGPLALGDLIGLDVVLFILEEMQKETGNSKYEPNALLREMVRDGKLGRKTNEGFYKYN